MSEQSAPLTLEGHDILFPPLPYTMDARVEEAIHDEQLQRFVNSAARGKDVLRKQTLPDVFGGQDHYDAVRKLAGSIKQHTLDNLDYYLEQFIDNATAAGTQVHFASDGDEANEIILGIAKQNNLKICVKSKSMVTEETSLLPALEGVGVETIETDLGEFIIQLDHDAPSHIVTPMIHKDRTAVGRAFQRELGVDYTDDPATLTQIAREYLRKKFRKADLGMSGGNFLVAETGSVVICTNEGNGRMCTSVPRVHVAVVGIEKVVPRTDHLALLLKLLARSATAQPLTCYTHIMTGPRREGEHDGPEQMHVVLVDNGRTEILREETREMLRCIRCGACLNACPVYRKVGGHAYGAVYSGPIGSLITPMFKGLGNFKDLPQASSLCGACFEACPVHINIPKYLIQLRGELTKQNMDKVADRVFMRLWAASLRTPLTYRFGGWMQKVMFRAKARPSSENKYADRGWIKSAPGPVAGWTSQRDLPTPPAGSFRQWWEKRDD